MQTLPSECRSCPWTHQPRQVRRQQRGVHRRERDRRHNHRRQENSPHRWRLDYSRQIPPLLPRSRDTRQHQWDTCFRCISHSISENTQRHHRIRSSARHQHRHKRRWHTLQGAHKVTSHHTAASQAAHEITQVKAQAAAMNAATCAFIFFTDSIGNISIEPLKPSAIFHCLSHNNIFY